MIDDQSYIHYTPHTPESVKLLRELAESLFADQLPGLAFKIQNIQKIVEKEHDSYQQRNNTVIANTRLSVRQENKANATAMIKSLYEMMENSVSGAESIQKEIDKWEKYLKDLPS